jgi:hypothetical protein
MEEARLRVISKMHRQRRIREYSDAPGDEECGAPGLPPIDPRSPLSKRRSFADDKCTGGKGSPAGARVGLPSLVGGRSRSNTPSHSPSHSPRVRELGGSGRSPVARRNFPDTAGNRTPRRVVPTTVL